MTKKEQLIVVEGMVEIALPDATFRVKLDQGGGNVVIIAHTSGRMRKNRVRILVGDKVRMEVSIHDKTRGRIIRRL